MKYLVTILFFALLSSALRSQAPHNLATFPSWAVGHGSLDYTTLQSRASGEWASVAPEFRAAPLWTAGDVSRNDFRFAAQSNDGVIAVWSLSASASTPLGGIASAFTDILFMDVVETGSLLAGHTHALIWSGRKASGKWGIQMLGLNGVSLDQANVLTAGVESVPGEVWLSCGIAGSRVYILDAASGSLLRLQSVNDFLDSRDPMFGVSLDLLRRRPISRLAEDPQAVVRICFAPPSYVDCEPSPEWVDLVKETSPGQFELTLDHRPDPAPAGPFFVRDVVGGATLVVVAGPGQGKVVVESAPGNSGPWTPISPIVSLADHETALVALSLPLIANHFVRLAPVNPGPIGEIREVAPDALTILFVPQAAASGAVPKGAEFSIRGTNFPSAGMTVTFEYGDPVSGSSQVAPLAITGSDESSVKVVAPMVAVGGSIVISTTTSSARYPLKFK